MVELADELAAIATRFFNKYSGLADVIASKRPGEDEWSLKEIIGHLIDSASNNHQRFVRLQLVKELIFPHYYKDNMAWVAIAKYNEMAFEDVLLLWKQFNLLIASIIRHADANKLDNCWNLDGNKTSLRDLMADYVVHLKGHLQSFEELLKRIS